MKYLGVSTKSLTSAAVTVYVGGPFSHSVTRANANSVWRDDTTGKPLGRMSVEKMRKKLTYYD